MNNKEFYYLLADIKDKVEAAINRNMPIHTRFYNLAEQHHIEQSLMNADHVSYIKLGGYEGAERCIFAIYPVILDYASYYLEPIKVLKIGWNEIYHKIGHRDILGALLGLGIKREILGDIIVNKSDAYVFVLDNMLSYIRTNLLQVGNASVIIQEVKTSEVDIKMSTPKSIESVVPSLRLDCIVSAGFRISRTRSVAMIKEGRVMLDWSLCQKPSKLIDLGAVITIRGMGRIKFTDIIRTTQRDNLYIKIEVYK